VHVSGGPHITNCLDAGDGRDGLIQIRGPKQAAAHPPIMPEAVAHSFRESSTLEGGAMVTKTGISLSSVGADRERAGLAGKPCVSVVVGPDRSSERDASVPTWVTRRCQPVASS